jgi:uncharacterized membrane protein YdfJ with MMPL/SSD domain
VAPVRECGRTMAKYSWLDVALWLAAVMLLIPLVMELVGSVLEALR